MILADDNNFKEIKQKEDVHKTEFDYIITQIENTMLELDSSIENCKTISETSKLLKFLD